MSEGELGPLMPVHQCEDCSRLVRRSDLNDDATITGLYICPHCGCAGRLHITIVRESELLSEQRR